MKYLHFPRLVLNRYSKQTAVAPFAGPRTVVAAASLSLTASIVYWAYRSEKPFLQPVHALSKSQQTFPTPDEVREHNNPEKGIWVVVNGKVYDLTEFRKHHPGGAKIIEKYGGTNASLIYNKFHKPHLPEKMLPRDKRLGPLIGEMEPAPDITANANRTS